jgi:hypothetical protein
MSYHQGSVWPLFTGWAALAEYRAGQPLSGQQMLMQNVDLTWAQDPGAVTELLSGDFYVPFGRSTSHQLWSSAMVITPALRGLFGIEADAATNTITVNPHLPAWWATATVHRLNLGGRLVDLEFTRDKGRMNIVARAAEAKGGTIHLRSDMPGAQAAHPDLADAEVSIPLPALEFALMSHSLPTPGVRPGQFKVLSTQYEDHSATLMVAGPADTDAELLIHRNRLIMPKLDESWVKEHAGTKEDFTFVSTAYTDAAVGLRLSIHFPPGEGWQTARITLTW